MKLVIGQMYGVEGRKDLKDVTLVDVGGGVAYIELKTGVEMDFPVEKIIPFKEDMGDVQAISDDWMATNIDAKVLGRARMVYTRATMAEKNKVSKPWDKLDNVLRMNMIAALKGDETKSGMDIYNEINSGEMTKDKLTAYVEFFVAQNSKK